MISDIVEDDVKGAEKVRVMDSTECLEPNSQTEALLTRISSDVFVGRESTTSSPPLLSIGSNRS